MSSLIAFVKRLIGAEVPRSNQSQRPAVSPYPTKPVIEAIVTQTIAPGRKGQVKFQGSWWTARCRQGITLRPGKPVHVIGRQTITLYVEPVFSNAQGQ